jgi:hypothetical protein
VFFKQILESVEPFYHEKMARTLQIALAARQPAPAAIYKFQDDEYEDEEYALKLPLKAFDQNTVSLVRKQVERRLSGRRRGLLEINHLGRVEFLHRTVMDYLRTPDMLTYLSKKTSKKTSNQFNANLSLLRAFTAYIKSGKFKELLDRTGFAQYTNSRLMSALKEALDHASQLQQNLVYKLLDELAWCIPKMHHTGQAKLNVWGNLLNLVRLFFWEPVINSSLVGYLHHALPKIPGYFPKFQAPAESVLVFFMITSLTNKLEPHEQMSQLKKRLEDCSDPIKSTVILARFTNYSREDLWC